MPLPSFLLACIDDACSRGTALIERACDHAETALEEERRRLDSPLDRQDYTAALHELTLQRIAWSARFPDALRQAIQNPPRKAGGSVALRPSSLSLVDDSELMQSIETSRLTQQLASLVEQPLAELDTLMSTVLGLEGVQPEHNPLRPELFATALRGVLGTSEGPATWPALWMRHMAKPMGEELRAVYIAASKILKQARVEAATYRVITSPAPLTGMSQPMSQPMPMVSQPLPLQPMPPVPRGNALQRTASGFVDLVTHALRGPLFADFLSRGSAQEKHALDGAYFARVDEELAQLEGGWDEAPPDPQQLHAHQHLPVVERPVREVGTATPLSRETWGTMAAPRQRSLVRTRLKRSAQTAGQVMGVEAVRQLVEQVARDPRLLAPVREAIVALEPSLARLALQSPRFLGLAEHPARQLMERVAERSFKYNDEFGSQFQDFFADVTEHFRALNSLDGLADEAPFEFALQELQGHWTEEDREEEAKRKRLKDAVRFAEQRQHEAGEIAWGMSQRSDLEGVPAAVQDFLFGRWALVMAHARLKGGGRDIDPGGYGAVVSDLLWTVKRDTVLRDPARAFELIPRVVVKLRAGLDMIGEKPADNDVFFQALERMHRPVLKLRAKHRKQAFEVPTEIPVDDDLAPAKSHQPPAPAEELWLAPDELQGFGFEDTMPSDFAELPAPGASPGTTAQVRPMPAIIGAAMADGIVGALHVGHWVDLFSRNKWRRAQLTWTSNNGAFFMFTSHGGRPHSMTKRSLHRLVVSRLVRPIESHEVVQHAIDHIARAEPQPLAA